MAHSRTCRNKTSVVRGLTAFIMLIMTLQVFGKGDFKPKSMEIKPFDASASVYERRDLNGQPCALVKVILLLPDIGFEGNIVGNSDFKKGEYWVYLTGGTKKIKLKHASIPPMMIEFADFGIPAVESKSTYELVIEVETDDPEQAEQIRKYAEEIETLKHSLAQVSETDDHKFQRAKENRNIELMKELAENGYEKAYLPLAEMYSDADKLDEAELWARKAAGVSADSVFAKLLLRNIKSEKAKKNQEENSLTNRKKAILEGFFN